MHTEVSREPCKSGIGSFAWRVAVNCIPSHVEENKPCMFKNKLFHLYYSENQKTEEYEDEL